MLFSLPFFTFLGYQRPQDRRCLQKSDDECRRTRQPEGGVYEAVDSAQTRGGAGVAGVVEAVVRARGRRYDGA
jgi:hypothetical protein